MQLTPYQIIVPLLAMIAIFYAWNLVMRQRKTLWEALLWSVFWGAIAAIALFPDLLGYLTAVTGIKSRENAVVFTSIGVLFFMAFYIIVRIEELEQRQTRIIREVSLEESEALHKHKTKA